MPSVDGNYLKMQGELTARMQVAYQAETQAQQARARVASEKAMVRLKEEVGAMSSSKGHEQGPATVGEQGEGAAHPDAKKRQGSPSEARVSKEPEKTIASDSDRGMRLDVRA